MASNTDTTVTFPIDDNTSNIKDTDNESGNPIIFKLFFTVPLNAMLPNPVKMFDFDANGDSLYHLSMFVFLYKLCCKRYYTGRSFNIKDGNGIKFDVFMEYLLKEHTDPENFNLIDCVGIRFHFYVYDSSTDVITSFKKLLAENRGEDPSSVDSGDNKKPKKKRPVKQHKKDATTLSGFIKPETMESIMDLLNEYIGNEYDEYVYDDDEELMDNTGAPLIEHPLHPQNVLTWENSFVDKMNSKQREEWGDGYSYKFSFPAAVYKLPLSMFHTHMAILAIILPRTPLWFDQGLEKNIRLHLKNEDRLIKSIRKSIKRNDINDLIIIQNENLLKFASKYGKDDDYFEKLRNFREESMIYQTNVWKPNANVSDTIKELSRWIYGRSWTLGPMKIIDSNMTFFGNMIANDFIYFDTLLKISTSHNVLFRVLVNSLDSYRHQFNLHNNIVMFGEGATGKSHILDTVCELFRPRTTSKTSHSTAKAGTTGQDVNDHVTVQHELPPLWLGIDPNGSDTGSSILKDLLTSCKLVTTSMAVEKDVDPHNSRVETKFESERIGVFISATNERQDKIPQALGTRYITLMVNEHSRKRFTVNDITSNSIVKMKIDNEGWDKSNYIEWWNIRQAMVCMVEKSIACKHLNDVNMQVYSILYQKVTKYLTDTGVISCDAGVRDKKFLENFARSLTILHAVTKFSHDPNSEGFGKQFNFSDLCKIQPLLFCTEEIALFTLTVNVDQLVSMHHFKTIEVMLYAVRKAMVNLNPGTEDTNEYYNTKGVYPNAGYIYKDMITEQGSGLFRERISPENMKVAFHELKTAHHKGLPIMRYSSDTSTLSINKDFVNTHYKWNGELGRYVCMFDISKVIKNAFYNSYSSKHTKRHDAIITGTQLNNDTPFLLSTMKREPNPSKILSHYLPISVASNSDFDKLEENEYFVRDGVDIKMKVDYEGYCYEMYMKECGFCDMNLKNVIYDYAHGDDGKVNYPDDFVRWYDDHHGNTKRRKTS